MYRVTTLVRIAILHVESGNQACKSHEAHAAQSHDEIREPPKVTDE